MKRVKKKETYTRKCFFYRFIRSLLSLPSFSPCYLSHFLHSSLPPYLRLSLIDIGIAYFLLMLFVRLKKIYRQFLFLPFTSLFLISHFHDDNFQKVYSLKLKLKLCFLKNRLPILLKKKCKEKNISNW